MWGLCIPAPSWPCSSPRGCPFVLLTSHPAPLRPPGPGPALPPRELVAPRIPAWPPALRTTLLTPILGVDTQHSVALLLGWVLLLQEGAPPPGGCPPPPPHPWAEAPLSTLSARPGPLENRRGPPGGGSAPTFVAGGFWVRMDPGSGVS